MRHTSRIPRKLARKWGVSAAALSFTLVAATTGFAGSTSQSTDLTAAARTASPIKHVIILIGENRGTDHTFGVYKPHGKGQTISNFLSKGIVNENGSPGPNFSLARQFQVSPQPLYYVGAPDKAKAAYGERGRCRSPTRMGRPPHRVR